jgi:hypothetical protein
MLIDNQDHVVGPNGSDGVISVPSGTKPPHKKSVAKRINHSLNDYSALISAITGLTVAIYTLTSVITAIWK